MPNNFQQISIWNKIHIDKILFFFIILLLIYSIFIVWSASGQNIDILKNKINQIIIGFFIMVIIAQIPPKIYEKYSLYLYILCIFLLILVNINGEISRGAKRWLNLGFIRFQPSEIAKIAVPLVIARFVHRDKCPPTLKNIFITLIIIFIPTYLVAIQPDMGTAILIIISGLFILFLSGVSWTFIIITNLLITVLIPIIWFFLMHDYQRERIIILQNSTIDLLGAGYHITQSKIAIGSGGLTGKGWLHGTQAQLNFLPERHTDFIFAVLGEELGLIGIITLLILYLGVIIRGLIIAIGAKNIFERIIVSGIILIFFLYIFVNISMVSGVLPVVGVPLPIISYGGSALIILMIKFGIIMSIQTHKKIISRNL